jgi:hypothetical protein
VSTIWQYEEEEGEDQRELFRWNRHYHIGG